jgi:hypothetical protein
MRRLVTPAAAALALAAFGCSGAAPKAAGSAARADDPAAPQAAVMQMVLPDAVSAVYYAREARGEGAARQPKTLTKYFEELPEEIRDCGLEVDKAHEVMVSAAEDEKVAVAARLAKPAAKLVDCVAGKGFPKSRVEGRPAVKVKGHRVIDMGAVSLVGDAEDLDVLSFDVAPPRWFELVSDADGTLVGEYTISRSRSLRRTAGALVATIREASSEEADFMANVFRGSIDAASASVGRDGEGLTRWLGKAQVRRAPYFGVEVTVPSGATLDASRVAAFEKFADELAQRVERKHAESRARGDLVAIALRLHAYASEHKTGLTRVPSFPSSAPPTPAEVPTSEPIFLGYGDWQHATWRSLEFSCDACQFSYQVETSSDKRHTVARAVADHDGDGDLTVLEVRLDVDPSGKISISDIEITNPLD